MSHPLLWAETFTGTASMTLQLMGNAPPPIGYMGSKRRWARLILDLMGQHERPDVVVLCDAGPWGEAWEVILDAERRPLLVERLRSWGGEDPSALWRRLAEAGRPEDGVERVASWLWLQGRAANNSPVWWEDGALLQPGGSSAGKLMEACQQGNLLVMASNGATGPGNTAALERSTAKASTTRHATSGVTRTSTVADRIEHIGRLPWPVVHVVRSHADALALMTAHAAAGGRVVTYHDPPYVGCTRYAAVCPREDVLHLARTCAALGPAAVSEAVPLPLDGWHTVRLTEPHARHAEWLTMSVAPAMAWPAQLTLWATP